MAVKPTNRTVVVQSHRMPLPHGFLRPAMDSVARWAAGQGFDYEFLDDQLFERVARDLRHKCADQLVVATDLARLCVLQELFAAGAQRVVWCDADTLIFAPELIELPDEGAAFGREIWLQEEQGKLRIRRKIHNAFMVFCADDPVLDFYAFAAERVIRRHAPPEQASMVAQLVGPKFLTLLHNVLEFDVLEGAQVLSPPLLHALLDDNDEVLALYHAQASAPAYAMNLCASEIARGSINTKQIEQVIVRLLNQGLAYNELSTRRG